MPRNKEACWSKPLLVFVCDLAARCLTRMRNEEEDGQVADDRRSVRVRISFVALTVLLGRVHRHCVHICRSNHAEASLSLSFLTSRCVGVVGAAGVDGRCPRAKRTTIARAGTDAALNALTNAGTTAVVCLARPV